MANRIEVVDMDDVKNLQKEENNDQDLLQQEFEEKVSWFYVFNWKYYLNTIPLPKPFAPNLNIAYDIIEGPLFPQFRSVADMRLLIQRDPDDYISLENGNQIIEAHTFTWMYTLDYFLSLYIQMKVDYDTRHETVERIQFDLPDALLDKFSNHNARASDRKKKLFVGMDYFDASKTIVSSDNFHGERYSVAKLGASACINFLCRSITTRPDATKQIASLEYDSMIFSDPENPGIVPPFQVEDYFFHEFYTGISLSIEIASVFIEVNQLISDKNLWDMAFDVFCKKALPSIVQSSMFYARNSVARLFFQQFLIEVSTSKYMLNSPTKKIWEDHGVWNQIVERANMHIQKLQLQPYDYPYHADEQTLDFATNYLKELISKVENPLNIIEYAKDPIFGLAAFCNSQHKNVSLFLDEIRRYSSTNKKYWAPLDAEHKKALAIFNKVHRKVKEAIAFLDDLKVFGSEQRLDRFNFSEIYSLDILKSYSAFANTNGGLILLSRPIAQFNNVPSGTELTDNSKRDLANKTADNVINDLCKILDNAQKTSRNIIQKNRIQIKEIDRDELIAIWVTPKKSTAPMVLVGDNSELMAYLRKGNENILHNNIVEKRSNRIAGKKRKQTAQK